MGIKKVIAEIIPSPSAENVGEAPEASKPSAENAGEAAEASTIPDEILGEELAEIEITIETAIDALEVAKEQAVNLLGTDIEHLFEPIEVALNYKAKQIGSDASFAGLSDDEAAQKQVEEKEAAIVAMQEAAARRLEHIRQGA